MRILITGGAGFLGSHISDYLLKKGHTVVVMDNLLTGSISNIEHLFGNPNFSFIRHDVTNYIHVPGEINAILHFASPASPDDYLKFPIPTLKVGALGTHKALGLAKEKGAIFMKWFDWFYHKGDKAAKYPFSVKQLEQYAAKVADAVGLEVYGGDAIVTPAGRIYVIDINSWPSFARVRNTVKTHIAKHVFDRAAKKAAIKEKVK